MTNWYYPFGSCTEGYFPLACNGEVDSVVWSNGLVGYEANLPVGLYNWQAYHAGQVIQSYPFEMNQLGWGLNLADSYWEGDGPATGGSLSSGLSPRESRPRQQEWDHAEAMERLAAQASAYGHAMRQQLLGRGPVSATDALPARLAAQQLGSLAGMSRKVRHL